MSVVSRPHRPPELNRERRETHEKGSPNPLGMGGWWLKETGTSTTPFGKLRIPLSDLGGGSGGVLCFDFEVPWFNGV